MKQELTLANYSEETSSNGPSSFNAGVKKKYGFLIESAFSPSTLQN